MTMSYSGSEHWPVHSFMLSSVLCLVGHSLRRRSELWPCRSFAHSALGALVFVSIGLVGHASLRVLTFVVIHLCLVRGFDPLGESLMLRLEHWAFWVIRSLIARPFDLFGPLLRALTFVVIHVFFAQSISLCGYSLMLRIELRPARSFAHSSPASLRAFGLCCYCTRSWHSVTA